MRPQHDTATREAATRGTRSPGTTALETGRPEIVGVALLGATGVVGQNMARLLREHAFLRLDEVMASERSAGRAYGEVIGLPPGDPAAGLRLKSPGDHLSAPVVLSALPSDAAVVLEPEYARRGHLVCSNASAFRDDPRVPLLVPEINAHALALLDTQEWSGGLITNPNCVVSGLSLALAPLHARHRIESITIVTLQALSGAGRRGLSAWDSQANVIPHIAGEAGKIPAEIHKILGADFPVSVQVNRVPVLDGHLLSVFVKLRDGAPLDAIQTTLRDFAAPEDVAALPTAPDSPLRLLEAPDRPQPLIDLDAGSGMTVTVGSFAADPVYDACFTVLVHNLVRGAAGACLLNAELAVTHGFAGAVGRTDEAAAAAGS